MAAARIQAGGKRLQTGGKNKKRLCSKPDLSVRKASVRLRSPASNLQPDSTATVIYRSGHNWKTKRNFEVFSATDFLAAAVEHIPDRPKDRLETGDCRLEIRTRANPFVPFVRPSSEASSTSRLRPPVYSLNQPIRTPPEFQWWKPEASDPAQFELQVPHWSPDFEFQDWQQAADSAESATSWQATELTLDAERTLALDSDQPALEEFPEFFYD